MPFYLLLSLLYLLFALFFSSSSPDPRLSSLPCYFSIIHSAFLFPFTPQFVFSILLFIRSHFLAALPKHVCRTVNLQLPLFSSASSIFLSSSSAFSSSFYDILLLSFSFASSSSAFSSSFYDNHHFPLNTAFPFPFLFLPHLIRLITDYISQSCREAMYSVCSGIKQIKSNLVYASSAMQTLTFSNCLLLVVSST